jgi:3-hydroxyisobutyrate dehydrogenase
MFHVGIFKNGQKNTLIIDCSTISPVGAADLNKKAKQHGMTYVDAPVTGAIIGARAGTLTFMVGA